MSIIFAGMEDRAPTMLPASDTRPSLPPIGATVGVVVASITAGAAAATLFGDSTSVVEWLTAAGLCCGLFALTRLFTRDRPTPMRFLVLLALACLTFSYLLILGGESTPRPVRRDALGFISLLMVLLGVRRRC